jgi:hypothetical protein
MNIWSHKDQQKKSTLCEYDILFAKWSDKECTWVAAIAAKKNRFPNATAHESPLTLSIMIFAVSNNICQSAQNTYKFLLVHSYFTLGATTAGFILSILFF